MKFDKDNSPSAHQLKEVIDNEMYLANQYFETAQMKDLKASADFYRQMGHIHKMLAEELQPEYESQERAERNQMRKEL